MKRIPDMRKLRNMVALADARSFARAATAVSLSQPAFSRSIQALESEIGAPLVERRQGGLQLSAVGERLVCEARHLLQTATRLYDDAREWASGQAGVLTIGMGPMVASLLGAFALRSIAQVRPGARVGLVVADGPSLQIRLRNLELDFFIASRTVFADGYEMRVKPLAVVPLGLLVRQRHPLLQKKFITGDDLSGYPLAWGTSFYSDLPGRSGVFSPHLLCDNYHVLRELTATSDVVWLSSPLLAAAEVGAALSVLPHPVDRWYPDRTELVVFYPRARELSPLATAALKCILGWEKREL